MRVLLVGSSFSAMPMLRALLAKGADVTVAGRHPGDPCHSYGHSSEFIDYSERDALLACCRRGGYDFIVPTCNDYSYVSAANAAAELGYPGFDKPDVTAILHTKDLFRRFCSRIGIPAPKVFGEFDKAQVVELGVRTGSVIIKPVDSFSGRGVEVVAPEIDVQHPLKRAFSQSRLGRVVVEQFVEGSLHSHTAFISSGSIIWHDFVDEFCEVYPYQVDRSHYPSRLSPGIRSAVNESMQQIVSELRLCDGLLHTQFVSSHDGYWIIECMRRCPGDLYGHHFKLALGFDYEAQYVAGFLGERPEVPHLTTPHSTVDRQVISAAHDAAFFGVSLETSGDRLLYIPLKESGEAMGPAPFDKAGIAFLSRAVVPESTSRFRGMRGEYYDTIPLRTAQIGQ